MKEIKYFCKECKYEFRQRGKREPRICPACGRDKIRRNYDAASILDEISRENRDW
jgi:predicted Zn-ribbon and HTH transcriptional regulator